MLNSKSWNDLTARKQMVDIKKNYHIYQTPPLGQDMTQGQFLNGF